MKTVEGLLKEVAFKIGTLQEARKRFSAQLAPDFNLFDYLRTDEMGVSKVIADLLDPKGAHGQGAVFLNVFAKILEQEWITSTNDWRVVTEQQANGQRRIDVYLESDIGVIGIENKPWAIDQPDQLKDYAEHLEKQAGNKEWRLIYLGNNEPSTGSISKESFEKLKKDKNLIPLDFHKLVGWLNDCAAQSKALVVRVFIEELAKFVRTNITGELEMSEEQEVISEIMKSPEKNIEAAFHVSNSMSALKQGLLQKFQADLKSQLDKKGFHLVWDTRMSQGWGTYAGFGVKFEEQDKYLYISFEGSGLTRMFWGIHRESESVKDNAAIWQEINSVMQQKFGHSKQWPWWPWCSTVPDTVFDKDYKNWGTSAKPWVEIDNGELVKKIVSLADQIFNLFQASKKIHLLQAKAD
jgi:hypothetical protein